MFCLRLLSNLVSKCLDQLYKSVIKIFSTVKADFQMFSVKIFLIDVKTKLRNHNLDSDFSM